MHASRRIRINVKGVARNFLAIVYSGATMTETFRNIFHLESHLVVDALVSYFKATIDRDLIMSFYATALERSTSENECAQEFARLLDTSGFEGAIASCQTDSSRRRFFGLSFRRNRPKSKTNDDEALARAIQGLEYEDVDILQEQRAGVNNLLQTKASNLQVKAVKANPHSQVGLPLYNRFYQAWQRVGNQSILLVFHGTLEANIGSICQGGLDPKRRSGQSLGMGEYFGKSFSVSRSYCKGGRKMLVFAVLEDPSGVTHNDANTIVIHNPEHHLPIFVVDF